MSTRQATDYWGNRYEITDDEGRMLWAARNGRGTYQPPAGRLETAQRLIDRGLLERDGEFASLTTTDDGYWVAASWHGEAEAAAERRRDYLDMQRYGR